jgi:transcriptional/translational regulatory protein YebC/TACO1
MAGHSKWSKVKRFKGALDAKRGKIFSRFSKEIMVAARMGGKDLNLNPRLRTAVLAARAQNMPNDTIDRAIKKGTGEIEGGIVEELMYEGYAPGGVAIILEAKNHGNLAASGAVSYLFRRRGQITVAKAEVEEDKLMEIALEAGAEDLETDEDLYIVTTPHDHLYQVGEAMKNAGIHFESQKLTFLATTTVTLANEELASQVLRLCDALEENDDVQNVYSNFDISDELLAKLSS